MSGDPFRDTIRADVDSLIAGAAPAIGWVRRDTLNTSDNPDASTGYFDLEFPGSSENQDTFGAPGSNEFKEEGQITLRVVAPLSRDRDTAETYASQLRKAYRGRRIAFTQYGPNRFIRINAVGAMGNGHTEGGMWAESIALAYQVFNVG